MRGETGLFLVEAQSKQFEADRGALLKVLQEGEKGEAVLPAAHADHDAVAVNDHFEIRDGLTRASQKFSLEQLDLVHILPAGPDENSITAPNRQS
jgi:hypothetical protein